MGVRLRITLNGPVDGLADHGLSVSVFAPLLIRLVQAYRRTASGLAGTHEALRFPTSGRFVKASDVDLQLIDVLDNCVTPEFRCVARNHDTFGLFEDEFLQVTADSLCRNIRAASTGVSVPELEYLEPYLRAVPTGVTQRYQVFNGDTVTTDLDVSPAKAASVEPTPSLHQDLVRIVGMVFESNKHQVCIKGTGRSRWLAATPSHVEKAIEVRADQVLAVYVDMDDGGVGRLIEFRKPNEPGPAWASKQDRRDYLFKRWSEVLRGLA